MKTYLIPTVYSTGGRVPLEYKIVAHSGDKRTTFVKNNSRYELNDVRIGKIKSLNMSLKLKGDRLIMDNGKNAYQFYRNVMEG